MNKYLLIFAAFLITGNLSAQEQINQTDSQGKKHGVWKKYYPNEQLRYEGRFKHGVEVDTFLFYFEDGALKAKNYFRKPGVAYSLQYGGNKKENLAAEGKYVNSKRDSIWTFYDIDGNVVSEENYKNDKKQGKSTTYFENGKPAEIIFYEDGVKEGEWKQFYDNGKLRVRGTYKNGKLQGEAIFYTMEGKVSVKGNYQKGLMHGNWYYFDSNMDVEKKEVWRYGDKISTEPEEEENDEEIEEEN